MSWIFAQDPFGCKSGGGGSGFGGRPIIIETRFEQVHGGIRNRFGQVPAAKSLREPDPAPFCGKVGGAPVARFN